MKAIFPAAALAITYAAVFAYGGPWQNLSLDATKLAAGELWRVLTFSFAHMNAGHLAENAAGILVAGALATELKAKAAEFAAAYAAAALAPLPLALATGLQFVGASSGVYGVFALVALEAQGLGIAAWKSSGAVVGIIFFASLAAFIACGLCQGFSTAFREGVGHFAGFSAGFAAVVVAGKVRRAARKRIFETS